MVNVCLRYGGSVVSCKMPAKRYAKPDPRRRKAERIWRQRGGDISDTELGRLVGASYRHITQWRRAGQWSLDGKEPGGQLGNRNALRHGAYSAFDRDHLTDEEREYRDSVSTDVLVQVDEGIKDYALQKWRLQGRLRNLKSAQTVTVKTAAKKPVAVRRIDKETGETTTVQVMRDTLDVKEVHETVFSETDTCLKIEEALGKAGGRLTQLLALKDKLASAQEQSGADVGGGDVCLDGFSEAEVDILERLMDKAEGKRGPAKD